MIQLPEDPALKSLAAWRHIDQARIIQAYLLRGKPRVARAYALFRTVVVPTAEGCGAAADQWCTYDYDNSAYCILQSGNAETRLLLTGDFWSGVFVPVDLLDLPEDQQAPKLRLAVEAVCRALQDDPEAYGG